MCSSEDKTNKLVLDQENLDDGQIALNLDGNFKPHVDINQDDHLSSLKNLFDSSLTLSHSSGKSENNDSCLAPGPDFSSSSDEYIPNFEDISSSSESDMDFEIGLRVNKYREHPRKKIRKLTNRFCIDSSNGKGNKKEETEVCNISEENLSKETSAQDTCLVIKKKSFSPKENISRKRKCFPNSWKKRKAALARQRGEAYLSYKNELIPKKVPKEGLLCREKCRLQCSDLFSNEDRLAFLQEFYDLDVNAKNALIFKCIHKKPVERQRKGSRRHKSASYKYSITKNGENIKVCKQALCSLYQIGRKKIDLIKSRIDSGVSAPPPDRRGRHFNRPFKMDEEVEKSILDHIKKFPVEESHYSRNRNPHKKYLSPLLNLNKMYQMYLEHCKEQKLPEKFTIKKCSYWKIFRSNFNLSFGHPKSDTCATCDAGDIGVEHQENYVAAFEALKTDRERAKASDHLVYITMDLQQTMPLPKIPTSKAFYLRQMWFYNFGVHIVTRNQEQASFMTWTEDVANRGSSEICSSLLQCIEMNKSIREHEHLVIWSDSCAGQNKNFYMICLYQYFILQGYFLRIDHKFPEVGHTYLDSDRDFGRIEKVLRRHDSIYLPEEYRDIIRNASRKNQVIDMAQHFRKIATLPDQLKLVNRKKNELNEVVRFRDGIKWIRVEEYGSYLYKESYDEAMPFKKVNILKNKNRPKAPENFQIERFREKYGTLSEEKKKNLFEQLKFVKPEYRYYYETILEN